MEKRSWSIQKNASALFIVLSKTLLQNPFYSHKGKIQTVEDSRKQSENDEGHTKNLHSQWKMTGVRDIGIDIRSKQGKSQPDSINTKKNKQMSHTKCVYLKTNATKKYYFTGILFFISSTILKAAGQMATFCRVKFAIW